MHDVWSVVNFDELNHINCQISDSRHIKTKTVMDQMYIWPWTLNHGHTKYSHIYFVIGLHRMVIEELHAYWAYRIVLSA